MIEFICKHWVFFSGAVVLTILYFCLEPFVMWCYRRHQLRKARAFSDAVAYTAATSISELCQQPEQQPEQQSEQISSISYHG